MRASLRKTLLFATLAVAAFVTLKSGRDKPPALSASSASTLTHPEIVRPASESKTTTASPLPLGLPERSALREPTGTLFGAQSWQPPPPPPKPAARPAQPTLPPLPYRFAGRVEHDGKSQFILVKGNSVIPVREGQTLDGAYRVETIAPNGITLVYLPLNEKVTIGARAGAPLVDSAAAGKPAQLSWEGPQRVKLGATFSVALRVTSAQPVRAAPIQLRFDPDVLESVDVQPGKYYGEGGGFSHRVDGDGLIHITASSRNPGPASNAELLVLTFKPIKAAPAAELSVGSLTLQGAGGQAIPLESFTAFKTAIAP